MQEVYYEIASCGTVRTWAKSLGRNADVPVLEQSLEDPNGNRETLTQALEKEAPDVLQIAQSQEGERPESTQTAFAAQAGNAPER